MLKPRLETDRQVAAALGERVIGRLEAVAKCNEWRLRQPEPHGPDFESWFACDWYLDEEPNAGGLEPLPSYSTDLNAAFAAAEKAGLFDFGYTEQEGSRFLDRVVDGGVERWRICRHVYGDDDRIGIRVIETAPTPALAICGAILKLAKHDS